MVEHFNGLTPAEAERLAMLIEECGEVITAATKILRHGFGSHHPDRPNIRNRQDLERELGDVFAVVTRMMAANDIDPNACDESENAKLAKFTRFTHHQ
jgi:NTP pyrophosphatase (non-canonical NTP hydrolase)